MQRQLILSTFWAKMAVLMVSGIVFAQLVRAQVVGFSGLPPKMCQNEAPANLTGSHVPNGTFFSTSPALNDQGNGTATFDPGLAVTGTSIMIVYEVNTGIIERDSQYVTVDTIPQVSFSGLDTLLCASQSPITLLGNHAPAGIFSSDFPGLVDNNDGTATLNPFTATSSTYYAAYSFTSVVGCTVIDTQSFSISLPVPVIMTGLQPEYCANETPILITGSEAPNGRFSEFPGLRDLQDGTAIFSPDSIAAPAILWIKYVYDNGCVNTDSQRVRILEIPIANAGPSDSTCAGEAITIGTTGSAGMTYAWTSNPSGFSSTTDEASVQPMQSTTYFLEVTDIFGCSGRDTAGIHVWPMPDADLGGHAIICSGDSLVLPGRGTNVAGWSWTSLPAGFSSTVQNPVVQPLSQIRYLLTASDISGNCSDSASILVAVDQHPGPAIAGDDIQMMTLEDVQLDAFPPIVGAGMWTSTSSGLYFDDPYRPDAMLSDLSEGQHLLLWTVSNGMCPDVVDSLRISLDGLFQPSGFSPNGDGTNDTWVIRGITERSGVHVQVFNRWGNLVYTHSQYDNSWDGRNLTGERLADDTYYYTLEIPGMKAVQGFLVIRR